MHSKIVLPSLALLAFAGAQNTCPNGQTMFTTNGKSWCCPGSVTSNNVNGQDESYCCVGGSVSFNSCFPFCSDSAGNAPSMAPCAATVYLTQSDYSQAISSAQSKLATMSSVGSTSATTTSEGSSSTSGPSSDGQASQTATSGSDSSPSSSSSPSTSAGAMTPSQPSHSPASASSSSTSSKNAGPVVTGGPWIGAAVVAGGLLMVA